MSLPGSGWYQLTPEAIDILTTGGAVGILAWLVLALINGWLVPRSTLVLKDEQLEQAQKDAEFWRNIALKGTDIAEQILQARMAELQGKSK